MSAATQIAIEEYLKTSYRPDREYIDGEVRERNLGEREHSDLQGMIYAYFLDREEQYDLHPFLDWRTQVNSTRFRVPDVCLVKGSYPNDSILRESPFIIVEVLSPEDSFADMADRVRDYQNFGTPNIWIVDPVRRRAWAVIDGRNEESGDLMLRTTDGSIVFPLGEVFARIDRRRRGDHSR
jgi:Uma2 family endonuclease